MELWREILIGGLQDESVDFINDEMIKEILEKRCYKVLLEIKQAIDDEKLSDKDCFNKIEKELQNER